MNIVMNVKAINLGILTGLFCMSLSLPVIAHKDCDDHNKKKKVCDIYKGNTYPKHAYKLCKNYCEDLRCGDLNSKNNQCCTESLIKFLELGIGDPICVAPQRAYITNFNPSNGTTGNTVTLCTVDFFGNFNNCADSGVSTANFDSPLVIDLNKKENTAYITNYGNITGNYTVSKCSIQTTGPNSGQFISPCLDSGAGAAFTHPFGIVLNKDEDTAYIANNVTSSGSPSVSKCSITSGIFGSCTDSGAILIGNNGPSGIVLNKAGTIAYFATDNVGNTIMKCSINGGMLGSCAPTGSGFNGPVGITLNNVENFAYVTNFSGNTVSKCSIDNNPSSPTYGNFITCVDSGAPASSFSLPFGITLNKSGDTAYVVNYSSTLSGTVSKCAIDINPSSSTNGNFVTCTDSGASTTPFNGPTWVTFGY